MARSVVARRSRTLPRLACPVARVSSKRDKEVSHASAHSRAAASRLRRSTFSRFYRPYFLPMRHWGCLGCCEGTYRAQRVSERPSRVPVWRICSALVGETTVHYALDSGDWSEDASRHLRFRRSLQPAHQDVTAMSFHRPRPPRCPPAPQVWLVTGTWSKNETYRDPHHGCQLFSSWTEAARRRWS